MQLFGNKKKEEEPEDILETVNYSIVSIVHKSHCIFSLILMILISQMFLGTKTLKK